MDNTPRRDRNARLLEVLFVSKGRVLVKAQGTGRRSNVRLDRLKPSSGYQLVQDAGVQQAVHKPG
jgi:hypothetical protein